PRYNGHRDVPLSDRGVAQYHALKPRLAGLPISACYTSDLVRSRTGGEIFAAHLGVEHLVDPSLREMSVGDWEGKTWDELMRDHPEQWRERLSDIVNYRTPGGENVLDVQARVMPVIRGIVQRHSGSEVLVVAHGAVNRIILLNAIGAPLSTLFNIEQSYGCMNIIDYYADGKSVVKLLNG
ncbi:MAG TPA: histidine phosphatase family protein, partial [Verrucomicrobiae bacterium]|nr:histidine phosphatase family protein [Verrucomicrobiae bacterium]